jgi:hypothetical protein
VAVSREMNISETGGTLCRIEAGRVTGFASQTVEEMPAVEEPLEIQLAMARLKAAQSSRFP